MAIVFEKKKLIWNTPLAFPRCILRNNKLHEFFCAKFSFFFLFFFPQLCVDSLDIGAIAEVKNFEITHIALHRLTTQIQYYIFCTSLKSSFTCSSTHCPSHSVKKGSHLEGSSSLTWAESFESGVMELTLSKTCKWRVFQDQD